MGQRVCTLVDEFRPAGKHEVTWRGRAGDGSPAPSGFYFCRLTTDTEQKHLKMLLLR
jgi:flagellar hook assembly protein FlgD